MSAAVKIRCCRVSNSGHLAIDILGNAQYIHFVIFMEFSQSFELFSNSRDDHLFHRIYSNGERSEKNFGNRMLFNSDIINSNNYK